nr:hypothetical protein [uncultured Cohaesibacter sp.]
MADYYVILKRAVEAVPNQSREQRQAIYDKARKALLNKLQNMDPPLPPSDISKQRMILEEAVRSVERDLNSESEKKAQEASSPKAEKDRAEGEANAEPDEGDEETSSDSSKALEPKKQKMGEILPPANSEKQSPTDKVVRRAGQDVLKNAVRDANALGAATNAAVKSAQDAADAVGEEREGEGARIEPTLGDAVVSHSKTYKRKDSGEGHSDEPDYKIGFDEEDDTKPRFGFLALVALVVCFVLGSGYLVYANRDSLWGSGGNESGNSVVVSQSNGQTTQVPGNDKTDSNDSTSIPAKSVKTIPVSPTPQNADSSAPANDGSAAQSDQDVNADTTGTGGDSATALPVAQRSILYEEQGENGEPGSASAGEALWALQGEGVNAVVNVDATIPDKKISFNLKIKKNLDAELPASHLIEISAIREEADESKAIVKVPGLILKPTEQSRGEGLVGAAIRIDDNLHWVALTSGAREERYNLELLHLRGWIDIPIQYQSGRRAILTLEKGERGDQVIDEAIEAWAQ